MLYVAGFLFAFVISLISTKLTIRLANHYGFIDDPKRKHGAIIHTHPIPRMGGVPVYAGTLCAVLLLSYEFSVLHYSWDSLKHLIGVLVVGFAVVFLGTLDDKYDISPRIRLLCMFLFAIAVVGFGVGVTYITNPLGGIIRFDQIVLPFYWGGAVHNVILIADIIAMFWIVSVMNTVNWSSGLDGQNAGISAITLAILGFSALRTNNISEPTALLSFIGSGAFAGFLVFSAYPQKIMPGFGGSTFSGFLIAVISILSGAKFATAIIVLAIPIIDAMYVFIRRLMRHQNPMRNDRTHLHHYLLDIGWSKRRIAFFYWSLCAILGIIALNIDSQSKVFVFVSVMILFLAGVLWIRQLLQSSKQYDHGNG
jgi:UDP-GlcNAc:undecaprenyl-phosphate GlcNAc-1-phosphate transferase